MVCFGLCLECSLRDDCLRSFSVCCHSSSPAFNRSKRTLNNLPIYLGEDLIDKINKEACLSAIKDMRCKSHLHEVDFASGIRRYESIMFHKSPDMGLSYNDYVNDRYIDDPNFRGDLTDEEWRVHLAIRKHTIKGKFKRLTCQDIPFWFMNRQFGILIEATWYYGSKFRNQKHFLDDIKDLNKYKISYSFNAPARCSKYVRHIYACKFSARCKFKNAVYKIIDERVIEKTKEDYVKQYGLYSKYFIHPSALCKRELHKQIIKKYDKRREINWRNLYDIFRVKEGINYRTLDKNHNFRMNRIVNEGTCQFRVYQFTRLCRLYHEATENTEKMFYIMKMGFLCYGNIVGNVSYWRVPDTKDAFYHYGFLGDYNSHLLKYFKDKESCVQDVGEYHMHHYNSKYYDLPQHIYKLMQEFDTEKGYRKKISFDVFEYDSYCNEFKYWWNEMMYKQVSLPKINIVRNHYKKDVMQELKKTKRKIRNDCGRKKVCKYKPTYMKMMAKVRAELKMKYHYNFGDPPYKGLEGLIHYIHIDLPNFYPWLKLNYLMKTYPSL